MIAILVPFSGFFFENVVNFICEPPPSGKCTNR